MFKSSLQGLYNDDLLIDKKFLYYIFYPAVFTYRNDS